MSHIFLEKAVLSGWDDNFADLSVREFVRVNRIRVYFRDISDRVWRGEWGGSGGYGRELSFMLFVCW